MDEDAPYGVVPGGLRLAVRLTPRSDRSAFGGVVRDAAGRPALQLRLAAPPVEGAANRALTAFIAGQLGLRASAVTLTSGAKARLKMLHLSCDGAAVLPRLAALVRESMADR